jgi:hypothetical protein
VKTNRRRYKAKHRKENSQIEGDNCKSSGFIATFIRESTNLKRKKKLRSYTNRRKHKFNVIFRN